jgi:hypothetical protein
MLMPIGQEERLWIADSKAIHHILQGTSYLYGKPHATRELSTMLIDRGLASTEGELSPMSRVV